MSVTSPNRGLFRLYATLWLGCSLLVVAATFSWADPPTAFTVIYMVVAGALWVLDMALVGRDEAGPAAQGHALAHALLVGAAALVWPLTITVVVVIFVVGIVLELRREGSAA